MLHVAERVGLNVQVGERCGKGYRDTRVMYMCAWGLRVYKSSWGKQR